MDEGDRDRSLADGGCHTLDIAAPDVADREHSGETGFEKIGRAGERPPRGGQVFLRQVRRALGDHQLGACAGVSTGNVWLAGELSRVGSAGSAMVSFPRQPRPFLSRPPLLG